MWGFLNSDMVEGDIFVGLKGNPHLTSLSEGDQVEFELRTSDSGKVEAVSVNVVSLAGGQEAGPVYHGWVKSFRDGWGFLQSDSFQGDLFVGLKGNPRIQSLAADDQVAFEIRTDDRGKQEAVNVRLKSPTPQVPAGPAVRAEVSHLVGQQVQGRIKSFREQWGFVNSESFVGDLFIHLRSNQQLGVVGPGDPVQFEVGEDEKSSGNFHAVNATVVKDDVRNLVGERVRGWVKSFKNNWGFLNSNRFDGDVFVGLKANSHLEPLGLTQGEYVEFQVARDDKAQNEMHATRVKKLNEAPVGIVSATDFGGMQGHQQVQPMPFLSLGHVGIAPIVPIQQASMPALNFAAGRGPAKVRPEDLVDTRSRGVIRSFKDGWGFVVSDLFEGDLFLHQGSNPTSGSLNPGDNVVFDIVKGSNGKCHATHVQVVPCEISDLEGRRCSGQVRSFRDNWGFVTSPKFAGDLFVGMKSNPMLPRILAQGDQIEFTVQACVGKSRGGFEAVDVTFLDGISAVPEIDAQAIGLVPLNRRPVTPHSVADARSRSPRQMPQQFLSGKGGQNRTGPPLRGAAPITPVIPTKPWPSQCIGQTCIGIVRSFRQAWGFVISNSFEGDLFVGTRSNGHLPRDLATNDRVQFQVIQGQSGKLEAANVQLL